MPCLVDHIAFHHQVIVDKFDGVGVVGMDTANLGSAQIHLVYGLFSEELGNALLAGQFRSCAGDNGVVSILAELPHQGGTHHPHVAGHENIFSHGTG